MNRPGAVSWISCCESSFYDPAFAAMEQQRNAERMQRTIEARIGEMKKSPTLTKEKSMFKEMVADVRGFVLENRGVIYTVAILFLADHFLFKGAFRERIRAVVEKMICRCEEKVTDAVTK